MRDRLVIVLETPNVTEELARVGGTLSGGGISVRIQPAPPARYSDHASDESELSLDFGLEDCAVLVVPEIEAGTLPLSLAALERNIPVVSLGNGDLRWNREMDATANGDHLLGRIAQLLDDPHERETAVRRGKATLRLSRIQAQLPPRLRRRPSARRDRWPIRPAAVIGDRPTTLSVVIACRDGLHHTRTCVETLLADSPDTEIVIVDNGSRDGTADWARSEGLVVVPFTENRGVAPAWNAGLSVARGDLLGVLNNDTVIHPGGVRKLAAAAVQTGIAAFQAGRLDATLRCRGLTSGPDPGDYPDGCALFFRRDVWERVGQFDEGMELAYCEDSDWGLRARSLGFDWEIIPDALFHLGQRTANRLPKITEQHARNEERLRLRWAGKGAGERIKIRRWGMLGDVLMLTPVLAELRRQKPLARIHLQCDPTISELLQGLPSVDVVSPIDRLEYTRVFDLDYATWQLEQQGHWRHPTFAFADMLEVPVRPEPYTVPRPSELENWASSLLPRTGWIACGLRSEQRDKANWGEASWLRLIQAMPDRQFVLFDRQPRPSLEPRGESYFGPNIYELPNVVDLTGRTPTLRHVAALLLRCAAAVCVDSGLFHLASAFALPVVALMGGAPGWVRQPLAGVQRVLQGEASCYPCSDPVHCRRDDGGPHCLEWITGERVAVALRSLEMAR